MMNVQNSLTFVFLLQCLAICQGFSINSNSQVKQPQSACETSRRSLFKDMSAFTLASIGLVSTTSTKPAYASGGATAGGAYLLSAKQRYNQRVTDGVKAFLALSTPLDDGSLEEAKAFFASEEQGGWKDASSAGYLLSNAFRRSSTTPPDSLPSVKKWKAFAAELETLQKSLKKKDSKGVKSSYAKAEVLLDAYLDAVELPSVADMRM